jgi:hypothetical protein
MKYSRHIMALSIFVALSISVNAQEMSSSISTASNASSTNTSTSSVATTSMSTSTNPALATSTASSTNTLESCDIKAKLNQKRDRVNTQIKKQLTDKNKLVTSLISVASSSSEEDKSLIQDSIIRLESEVLSLIKSQKEVLNIIASTTETSCANALKLKRENDKAQIKIKKISIDIEKKSSIINALIKNDIRAVVENIEE